MESGKEQNYWPGFVDALSNVVLTLVFVLVVFVFALVIASSKVTQKAQELADNAQKKAQEQIQNNQEVVHLQEELQVALNQLEDAKKNTVKLQEEVLKLKRQQATLVAEPEKAPPPEPSPPEPRPIEEIEAKPAAPEERNLLTETIKVTVDKAPERKNDPNRDDNPLVDQGTGAIVVVFPRGVFEMTDKARTDLSQALAPQKGHLSGTMITLKSIMGVESYSEAQRLAYYRGLNIRNYLMESGFGSGQTIKVLIEPAKEVDDARVEIRFNSR